MSPPLRSTADRDALRSALADGTIDMIATDHAPHDSVSKQASRLAGKFRSGCIPARLSSEDASAMQSAANGIVGLETAVGLALALVDQGVLAPRQIVELMAVNPARLLRLQAGHLSAGGPADITLIDPDFRWTVEPDVFRSRSRNMPYTGMHLKGRAMVTIVGGVIVHDAQAARRT
jgi:dihydroorotase